MLFFINLLLTVCCDYANLIVLIVMHNPLTAFTMFLLSFFFGNMPNDFCWVNCNYFRLSPRGGSTGGGGGGLRGLQPLFGKLADSSCLSFFHHKNNSILLGFFTPPPPPLKKSWIRPCLLNQFHSSATFSMRAGQVDVSCKRDNRCLYIKMFVSLCQKKLDCRTNRLRKQPTSREVAT